MVENLPASAGDIRDTCLIPESGTPPEGEHGSPLRYSCLENPMDREAWWATVHRVAKNRTRLSDLAHTPRGVEATVTRAAVTKWETHTQQETAQFS